jgi:serine-type D-Ala-D-Ala carboxypeptidase (penicillin-binding protein 5/6)
MKNNITEIQNKTLFTLNLIFGIPIVFLIGFLVVNDFKNLKNLNDFVYEKEPIFEVNNLVAQSAMVTELNTGKILFKLNEKEVRPIASITKLVTVLLAEDEFTNKNTKSIIIDENDLTAFGDSGLAIGQKWSLSDLIDYVLITSSNDGAKALALEAFDNNENTFISKMNSLSNKMGLSNTFFASETGLDIVSGEEAGALSTAEDVTKILNYIIKNKPEVFAASTKPSDIIWINDKEFNFNNTNSIVGRLPNPLISKTGYTYTAGGNLAVVIDFGLNNPISIVVLGSTREERENDVLRIIEGLNNYYSYKLKKEVL